ncbi:fibronectin type III domain-containing protein [Saccharothrix sp. MB29]|nr:fibronectin type III domain-containing protein [Saccharothrix sp. MB29]
MSWREADGQGHRITGYTVTATGADGSSATVQSASTGVVVPAGTLVLGQSYTFTATAQNDLGLTGSPSAPSGAVTPFAQADAPGSFTATPGDGSLALAWTTPDLGGGDLVGYVVSGNGLPTRTLTTTSTTYTGLANGTAHAITVHAVTRETGRTSGPQVTGAEASANGTPGTPPTVQMSGAASSGDRQITVNFTVDPRGSGGVTCFIVFNGAVRWSGGCGAGGQSITVGGLDYATMYDIYVEGSNSYGRGPASGRASARTNDPPPPLPSLTLAKGAAATGKPDCRAPCNFLQVEARNFAPNASYTVRCEAPSPQSYYTYTLRTNGSGAASSAVCYYGIRGGTVSVSVNDVRSNVVTW